MAATVDVTEYLRLVPALLHAPHKVLGLSDDAEGDVLYVNFKKPTLAMDSELTENDVIVRYDGEDIAGVTILHASKR